MNPAFRRGSDCSAVSDLLSQAFDRAIDSADYRNVLDVLDFVKDWDTIVRKRVHAGTVDGSIGEHCHLPAYCKGNA